MIRLATQKDIDPVMNITKACAKTMIANGIFQWNEHYPTKTPFQKDIERNELYIYEKDHVIIACIVISTLMDEEYVPVKWLTSNDSNIYIHRLAVHPNHQGKGIAQELMTFAETYARDSHYVSVRLDTFSQNKRNQKFYELRGYKRLGDIYFPKQSEYPFHCYELVF